MVSSPAHLREIAHTLRDSEVPSELMEAVQRFHRLGCDVAGAPGDEATQLRAGMAISPVEAARCTLDLMRTTRFVRGVEASLRELASRVSNRPLRILYAGTGPFAPLGLLPMALTEDLDQRWLLVDVHQSATRQLRQLLGAWRLEDRVVGVVQADALAPPLGEDWRADLIIAEVMQRSLAKEPQLAVMAALGPLLDDAGIFVPKAIELRLALADVSREFDTSDSTALRPRVRQEIAVLLRLDVARARELCGAGDCGGLDLGVFDIADLHGTAHMPMVRTTVEIFGDQRLDDYDSGITVPEVLRDLGAVRAGDRLAAAYELGPRPGLRIDRVGADAPDADRIEG